MTRTAKLICFVFVVLGNVVLGQTTAVAAPVPWWNFTTSVRPAVLEPGGEGVIGFRVANIGDAATLTENASGEPTPVLLTAMLPPGVTVRKTSRGPGEPEEPVVSLNRFPETEFGNFTCSEPAPREVRCKYETFFGPLLPFEYAEMAVVVDVGASVEGGAVSGEVEGGGAAPASVERHLDVGSGQPSFGVEPEGFSIVPEEEGGGVDVRAGSHPFQLTTRFALNQNASALTPPALPKELRFTLPAGLVANAATLPQCDELSFLTKGPGNGAADLCPAEAAVGVVDLTVREPVHTNAEAATYPVPVFNLAPKAGEPARFGFYFNGITVPIDFSVRTGSDYGAVATAHNITEVANFVSEDLTIWGAPGDPRHDLARGWGCVGGGFFQFPAGQPPCNPTPIGHPAPFLTLPTSCSEPFAAQVEGSSWPTKAQPAGVALAPGAQNEYSLQDAFGRPLSLTGCSQLSFAPSIEAAPDTREGSTASGFTVNIRVPREADEDVEGVAASAVRGIEVALPEGVTVNPAGANGLAACTEGEVGFTGSGDLNPVNEPGSSTFLFTPTLPTPFCPVASEVGTVDVTTPLLPATQHLKGAVYIATQNANPFGSLLAMYLVAEDPKSGTLVKLPGEVHLSAAGQLTTTFANNPQVPFTEASVHFFGGQQAAITTPSRCGTYSTHATFTPWSGGDPVPSTSSFAITSGPHGSPCPGSTLPFSPSAVVGTTSNQAGSFSPLVTTIKREDGDQGLQSVQVRLPKGLAGILTGVKLCPEAQANEGTCGPESQIGEAVVTAGVGGDPITIPGGKVYLTGQYGGSPFGLSIVSPVRAGPFDLERDTANPSQQPACDCQVVRARIDVDPRTTAITVTTDQTGPHAIPQLIDGVPVDIRQVRLSINRPNFSFNPTSCAPDSVLGTLVGGEGTSAPLAEPFQAVNCSLLKFTPKVAITVGARASRLNGAGLRFKVSYPAHALGAQAWFSKAKFDIPHQLPARLTTIQKACAQSVFDINPSACPKASQIGHAVVHTPVLPEPLSGSVYFVSHGGAKFPDAVMVLHGYGVTVDLVGETFINAKTKVTSVTFSATPDVPFESIEVNIPSGPTSEFGASLPASANDSFCGQRLTVPDLLEGQNGIELHNTIQVGVTGCKKKPRTSSGSKARARKTACKNRVGSRRVATCIRRALKRS